jgi:hypothetical protein
MYRNKSLSLLHLYIATPLFPYIISLKPERYIVKYLGIANGQTDPLLGLIFLVMCPVVLSVFGTFFVVK